MKICPKCGKEMVNRCRVCGQKGKILSNHTKNLISANNANKGKPSLNRGKPYMWIHSKLVRSAKTRDIDVTLTPGEFLALITGSDGRCHYCSSSVEWAPYHNNKTTKHATNIDRKENTGSYSSDNSVCCCWSCNQSKSSRYTHDDWYSMTELFRNRWLQQEVSGSNGKL